MLAGPAGGDQALAGLAATWRLAPAYANGATADRRHLTPGAPAAGGGAGGTWYRTWRNGSTGNDRCPRVPAALAANVAGWKAMASVPHWRSGTKAVTMAMVVGVIWTRPGPRWGRMATDMPRFGKWRNRIAVSAAGPAIALRPDTTAHAAPRVCNALPAGKTGRRTSRCQVSVVVQAGASP